LSPDLDKVEIRVMQIKSDRGKIAKAREIPESEPVDFRVEITANDAADEKKRFIEEGSCL